MNIDDIVLEHNEDTKHRDHQWQYDQINAVLNGKKIGYIRVAYINQHTIEQYRKEPLLLAYNVLSKDSLYKTEYAKDPVTKKLIKTHIPRLYNQAQYIALLLCGGNKETQDVLNVFEKMSDDQLQKYIDSHSEKVFKALLRNSTVKRHAQYHFCRPDIDFINVEEEFQGQGIGTLLYRKAAQWMAEKGMVLHSSTLQQEGAIRAWEHMKNRREADVLCIEGQRPRYRYVKNIDPKWLSEKIILQPFVAKKKNLKMR